MAENYTYGEIVYYKHAPGLFRFHCYVRRGMTTGGAATAFALCAGPDGTLHSIHPSLLRRDPWPS